VSDEPRYIIPCFLASPIQDYQRELVELIAERFGLTFTQRQAIPAHFTLKYHFATRHIGEVERLIGDFAREREPSPVEVGGFGHFLEDVVFVEVRLSEAARRALDALLSALRTLSWMSWGRHDAEGLRPHMTIAEQCRPRFRELWDFLPSYERRFTGAFDNITILRKVGETDGMGRWAVHQRFELGG
jgi:2'-5' RNA ligase